MPLFAESTVESASLWAAFIGAGIITGVGGAAVGLWRLYRKTRTEADHQDKQYDIEGLLRVIEVLERNGAKISAAYDVLQAGMTERLLVADRAAAEKVAAADRARHEAERKCAVLEERNRFLSRRIRELEGNSDDERPVAEGTGG